MPYSLLSKAMQYIVEKHDGSYRDGEFGLPYATHPVEVCNNLRYIGGITDVELLCAALLHDVIEETGTDPAEIESEFGPKVSGLVTELTRSEPTDEQLASLDKDEVWLLRSGLLLADITAMSSDAMTIKLADRLANFRQAIVTRKGEKLRRYIRQTKKIVEIIPKSVNPGLWKAINRELSSISRKSKS